MRCPWLAGLQIGVILSVIGVFISGCAGFGVAEVGEVRTAALEVDYPDTEETLQVVLSFGAAKFFADARGEKLVEGTVRYNVVGLKPEISVRGARVEIKQTSNVNPVGMINEWDVHFGREKPLRLEVNAGAYDGDWDLGGVPLRELVVNQGASRSSFDFSAPNPEEMTQLTFRTGAASLELRHLANAGFRTMSFDGGASSYTLDFGGKLMRDAAVKVTTGVSDLTIVIPEDMPAQVRVKKSVTGMQVDREFSQRGDTYVTPAWDQSAGPRLIIEIMVGLGNINLRVSPAQETEI